MSKEGGSLWNVSLSPGWTEEDVKILRLALMKMGVGNWTAIMESGCLPGKTVAQLNNQTQRMLGQQSTAEFADLHIDVLEVGQQNRLLRSPSITRKAGMIINTGGLLLFLFLLPSLYILYISNVDKLKPEEIRKKIEENRAKYEVPEKVWRQISLPEPDPSVYLLEHLNHQAKIRKINK